MEKKIRNGLKSLLSNLDGDTERVTQVIEKFITETPQLFMQIKESLSKKELKEAAHLVHASKVRYAYLGLSDKMQELDKIEMELKSGVSSPVHYETMQKTEELNEEIIAILKKPDLFESEINEIKTRSLEGKLVLVVEDDEINGLVFQKYVEETGASVVLASDGNEAIRLAVEKRPDFIFTDIHMPQCDGLEAITKIREQGITCPIISLSASTRLNEKQDSLDAGADEFLNKPADSKSIKNALMKYLA